MMTATELMKELREAEARVAELEEALRKVEAFLAGTGTPTRRPTLAMVRQALSGNLLTKTGK